MSALPRIPMHPAELPRQRLATVIALPPRPAGFEGRRDPSAPVPIPARMPRTARYIGQVEWAWSPMHVRLDAYYLSTNRERTHWFLWLRLYDDNWGRWDKDAQIIGYAPKQKVTPGVAAVYLLLDAWTADVRETDLDHFHWINRAAFLSVAELRAIARIAWPEPPQE
jgi:hypothetical protein